MSEYHENNERNNFWLTLQDVLQCSVPEYLLNLLTFNGFDTRIALRSLQLDDIQQMEMFAQTELVHLLPTDADLPKYFGIYAKKPSMFRIVPGHVKLMLAMRDYCLHNENSAYESTFFLPQSPVSNANSPLFPKASSSLQDVDASNASPLFLKASSSLQDVDVTVKYLNATLNDASSDDGDANKIVALLKTWINNHPEYNLQSMVNQDDMNASMVVLGVKDTKLKCFMCDSFINIVYILRSGVRKWIISNYVRHLKSHVIKNVSPMKRVVLQDGVIEEVTLPMPDLKRKCETGTGDYSNKEIKIESEF